MKKKRSIIWAITVFLTLFIFCLPQATAFEPLKGDLSNYDPNNQTFPTSGDTIKVAIWDVFTGPNAFVGQSYWALLGFVVHDINSQGGILVDGKKKMIQIIKADTQGKPAPGKSAAEKAILQDKVVMFQGVAGSHVSKAGQLVAKKLKKAIYLNFAAFSDELMDVPNWNRYVFRVNGTSSTCGKALAYFYDMRPEKKFYILGQDYLWGHSFNAAFKKALKKVRPDAEIVGEEYHPVFNKDFAPYMEKIKASGAHVIVTGAWGADNENTIKQSRQLGLKSPLNPNMYIPICSPFLDDTRPLEVIGGPAGAGLVLCSDIYTDRRKPMIKKLAFTWNKLWKKWKKPYNTELYRWPGSGWFRNLHASYWYFKVLEKAGSTDPEKVIAAWEGDIFKGFDLNAWMRPDDHQNIMDRPVAALEFPNMWNQPNNAAPAHPSWIPAKDCMPTFDEKLKGRVTGETLPPWYR
ncbi:MAG: ABC transporter substrate-binding protein [Deltaproteobacteria bacterium]|nr:ABC transporter substrate-binding protein [Deltaproteobacteria bacterium]